MRFQTLFIFCLIIFNCKTENKKECLSSSLIKKLDGFKYELADSLLIEKKQLSLVDEIIKKTAQKKRIALGFIEFDSLEIVSLINCFSDIQNPMADSNYLWEQHNGSYFKPIGFYSLLEKPKSQEYLVLYWLYHLIDKSFISNYINVLDSETYILNGGTLKDFSEIGKRITLRMDKLNQKQKERSVISIMTDKDDVDMEAIDRIENELREINALRINYLTSPE